MNSDNFKFDFSLGWHFYENFVPTKIACKKYLNSKSSVCTHMRTGNASGLAGSQVWNAGSGSGDSSEHPKTTFRVAFLNVSSLKSRDSEVVETMSRRRMDICAIQEHR